MGSENNGRVWGPEKRARATRRDPDPADALTDPRFIAALALLIANDHWAKAEFGNWFTGKLSDFAGLVVLPVVAVTALRLARVQPRATAIAFICGTWFTLVKSTAVGARITVELAEALTGRTHAIVVDPTDLIGLLGIPIALTVLRSPRAIISARVVKTMLLTLGVLATVATSNAVPRTDLMLDLNTGEVTRFEENGVDGYDPERYEGLGERVLALCSPSDAALCFQASDGEIAQSRGDTVEVVWSRDVSSPYIADRGAYTTVADRGFVTDMVFDRNGTLHVVTRDGTLATRSSSGEWTPPFGTYRPILEVSVFVALATFVSIVAIAMRRQTPFLWLVPPALVLAYLISLSGSEAGFIGWFVRQTVGWSIMIAGTFVTIALGRNQQPRWLALLLVPVGVAAFVFFQPQLAIAALALMSIAVLSGCLNCLFEHEPRNHVVAAAVISVAAALIATIPFLVWRNTITMPFSMTLSWVAVLALFLLIVSRTRLTPSSSTSASARIDDPNPA